MIEQAIMYVMALGALLGGLDRILGNRFGLGEHFENGFLLMGPTALSMAGVICLVPLLSGALSVTLGPLMSAVGLDPALLGGLLAIDMGGYQLATELAQNAAIGRFAGIVVAAIFGCTVTFTIPVGMGMLSEAERPGFARGIIFGLIVMPLALLTGGCLSGLSLGATLMQSLSVILLSALLLWGMLRQPERMVKGFTRFARGIQAVTTVGLALGAVQYMTGLTILPGLTPLEDAMAVVSSISIVMLGSLPVAELLKRLMKRPLSWIGAKTRMNTASMTGLMVIAVSVLPAIALMKEMDARGRVVNAACMVCATAALAAHLGFTLGVDAGMVLPMLTSKLLGGLMGAALALWATRKQAENNG